MVIKWRNKILYLLKSFTIIDLSITILLLFSMVLQYSHNAYFFSQNIPNVSKKQFVVKVLKNDSYDYRKTKFIGIQRNSAYYLYEFTDNLKAVSNNENNKFEDRLMQAYNVLSGVALIDKGSGNIYSNEPGFKTTYEIENKNIDAAIEKLKNSKEPYFIEVVDNEKIFNDYVKKSGFDKIDKSIISNFTEVYFMRQNHQWLIAGFDYARNVLIKIIVEFCCIIFLLIKLIINIIKRGYKVVFRECFLIDYLIEISNFFKLIIRNKGVFKNKLRIFFGITVLYTIFLIAIAVGLINSFLVIVSIGFTLIALSFFLLIDKLRNLLYLENIITLSKEISKGNFDYPTGEFKSKEFDKLAESIFSIKEGYKIALEERVKSEKLKTELIANVSHDLKTPLTSIINYVDILQREELAEDESRDYLNIIESKSLKLKSLINDIFEISKMMSGGIKLDKEDVDIVELLYQCLGEYSYLYEEKNIKFKVESPESLVMNLDARRISRVFENVISNALKYSLSNTRVYIGISEEDNEVIIAFKNIACYEMNFNNEEIFERFVRGDKSRNSEIDGSGLGLAIAKSIMDLHYGDMKVEKDGDVFKVYLIFALC